MPKKRMCPVSKFCSVPLCLLTSVLILISGIQATGNLQNFTARWSAEVNPATGNAHPIAPEVLLAYQLPTETPGIIGSEERSRWSMGQEGVKMSQSPNGHQPREQIRAYKNANLNSEEKQVSNDLGILLEALTIPLVVNNSMPCPKHYAQNPSNTYKREPGHDVRALEPDEGVKTEDQNSGRHITPRPLVSSRIISERTTIYPFMDATKAMDYLSNYDKRPRPKRWPLRILLTEAEQQEIESRKMLASRGSRAIGVGSAFVGLLETLTTMVVKSFTYTKRSKRQAQSNPISVTASLSTGGGPTGHSVASLPNHNSSETPNLGQPINRINEKKSFSAIQRDEHLLNISLNNTRFTKKRVLRRDRKRKKGKSKSKSRGITGVKCDEATQNRSHTYRVKEGQRSTNINKDDVQHGILNAKNSSSVKPSEETSVSPCDGYTYKKRKKIKRRKGFYKKPGRGNSKAPKRSSTTTPQSPSTVPHIGSSSSSSRVHATSVSRQNFGQSTTAETPNTGIYPDKLTAYSTSRIIHEDEALKNNVRSTDFHHVKSGNATEYDKPKSNGTGVWTHVSLQAGNNSDNTKTTSASSRPISASESREDLRQQPLTVSLDNVGAETTTSETNFKDGLAEPVTQTLISTNGPTTITPRQATVTYKNAFDFLSSQQVGLRRDTPSSSRREAEAFNLRLASNLCKVFGKRYVPTPIGGKCE